MDNRTLESYMPNLQLLKRFAANTIAEISTSQAKIRDADGPDSQWFGKANTCCVIADVIGGIAVDVVDFNFGCLEVNHHELESICERMAEILSDNPLVFDILEEMVEAERQRLTAPPTSVAPQHAQDDELPF
jgi:hypothetical protein